MPHTHTQTRTSTNTTNAPPPLRLTSDTSPQERSTQDDAPTTPTVDTEHTHDSRDRSNTAGGVAKNPTLQSPDEISQLGLRHYGVPDIITTWALPASTTVRTTTSWEVAVQHSQPC